ncbi:nuclear transport factor 2 family protein [Actinomadura scrupuli]|uniref:nuclear transport factor 2 family protein n=1 Tax=Actinomadura scrupuli TaxID=559629 RepID=UPI003D96F4E2
MDPKSRVVYGITELFVQLDPDAVYRHWHENLVQHSPIVPDDRAGLRSTIVQLKTVGLRYHIDRAIADGEWVVFHAHCDGVSQHLVAFNLFRVQDDRIIEHWEVVQPAIADTVNGNGLVDGPTLVADKERTDENRELVRRVMEEIFIGGQDPEPGDLFDGDNLIQHSPNVPNGVSGLLSLVRQTRQYDRLHLLVAEGNFVYAQSEGKVGGKPYAFNDLFRLENGKIVEHWDTVGEVPDVLPHNNSLFVS